MTPRTSALSLLFSLLTASGITWSQDGKPVVVSQVIEAQIKTGRKVVGSVQPLRTSTIGSAVDGRVKEFSVDQGQRVQQGEVLASLRTETLQIELGASKAELELAVQSLAELENGSRQEDLLEAEANLRAAEAADRNAGNKLERLKTLARTNVASESELEDAQEKADAARFAVKATSALYQRIKLGPRQETIAQARAQVELQKQRVRLITDRISKCEIRAPFDGFIAAEFTEVGAWIKQGDPVVDLIQMDRVEVVAPVTADIAANLSIGSTVRVEFPDLPPEVISRLENVPFTGNIERIVPATASRSRTFPVMVRMDNQFIDGKPVLLSGMLARVEFPAGEKQQFPLVPKDALVLNGDQQSVFVVGKDGDQDIAKKVDVSLGVAFKNRIQVKGDLTSQNRVVVVGNERLVPNEKIRVMSEKNEFSPSDGPVPARKAP